jgi:hypothetical protein
MPWSNSIGCTSRLTLLDLEKNADSSLVRTVLYSCDLTHRDQKRVGSGKISLARRANRVIS